MEESTITPIGKFPQPNGHYPDSDQWVEAHGDQLYCIAIARVGDRNTAEDLVQETFLAAWKGKDRFDGRSKLQTWLVAILKRKIADFYRTQGRSPVSATEISADNDLFDSDGLWKNRVGILATLPETAAENMEFWEIVSACIGDLPVPLAQSFHLRELDSKPTEETCQVLGISRKNLSVRLHRARLLLRRCLENRWLKGHEQ